MGAFEASIGVSMMSGEVSLTGPVFTLEETGGIVNLFKDGSYVASTSNVIGRTSFLGTSSGGTRKKRA